MTQSFHGDLRVLAGATAGHTARSVDRRSSDPIDQLGRRMNQVCTQAVDSLQIAAALEAAGINDRYAQQHMGVATVFDLAETLFQRIPLRASGAETSTARRDTQLREISHGVLFALPALFYPVMAAQVAPSVAAFAIALAVIAGWSWSQLVVRVSYLMQASGSASAAAVWLRYSALAGIGLVSVIAALTTKNASRPDALILIATAQMAYHMALTITIHYRREGLLVICLLPGLAAGLLYLIAPGLLPVTAVSTLVAASLIVALGVAASLPGETGRSARLRPPSFKELRDAAPFLLYGLLCALLVTFDSLRLGDWIGSAAFGLTIAPLVLSMGVLEWQLRSFRERVAVTLAQSTSTHEMSRRVWALFAAALVRYALVLAGLSAVSLYIIQSHHENVPFLTTVLLANWVLGCTFYIGFSLISQNRISLVTVFAAAALLVHLLNLPASLAYDSLVPTEATSYLLACLVFAMFLLSVARSVLCEVRNYSYDLQVTRQIGTR